jgi:Glycosyl transferase family 90
MTLVSRAGRSLNNASNQPDIALLQQQLLVDSNINDHDEKTTATTTATTRKKHRQYHRLLRLFPNALPPAMRRILRTPQTDSPLTRRLVMWLILFHVLLLWMPSTSSPCGHEAITSFRAWKIHDPMNSAQSSWALLLQSQSQSFIPPNGPRSIPSIDARIRHYMGRWYEPVLQGQPPQSPFGPYFNQHYTATTTTTTTYTITTTQQQHQQQQWTPLKLAYEPIPLNMDPIPLYECTLGASKEQSVCNNKDDLAEMLQRSMRTILDAALLLKERPTSFLSRMAAIWYYEGCLGWILEWPRLARTHPTATTAHLWSFGGVTKATHEWNVQTPVFGRVRDILADQDADRRERIDDSNDCAICGPLHSTILWPLERDAIMETLTEVPVVDTPFDDKKDKLVWRGNVPSNIPVLLELGTDVSGVQQRITLVKTFANHPLVDAKFIKDQDDRTTFPETLYDSSQQISMGDLLQHKYILAVEGTEASTDILWVLFSNSVLFLSNVTYTTWAMEDLLQPYVHYIPVHRNMSNVADQVRWAQQHPELCREIVKRSSQYVYDLFFHPRAAREEEQIMRAMIHRYDQFVLQAKPIVKWGHVFRKIYDNFRGWYDWLTEDWLRIAFLVVLLLLLCRL